MTDLSDAQRPAIDALVATRRIQRVPADAARATSFLRQAQERLDQLSLLTSVAVKYCIAYDAAHDIGESLLAAYGYRTRSGSGQHEVIGRYLKAVLITPPGDRAAGQFDRLRKARNRDRDRVDFTGWSRVPTFRVGVRLRSIPPLPGTAWFVEARCEAHDRK